MVCDDYVTPMIGPEDDCVSSRYEYVDNFGEFGEGSEDP